MKKTLVLLAILFSVNCSFGAFSISEPATSPHVETKASRERALMEMVVKMSVKDYETLRGKKMNFAEKIAFKITKKRFERQLKTAEAETEGFNLGGFALGFLLGLIGVLLAYIFSKDSNFRKWSWIGVGVIVAIFLIAAIL